MCQFSILWLNQFLGGCIKMHPPGVQLACGTLWLEETASQPKGAKLASLVEQKLSHTHTPFQIHPSRSTLKKSSSHQPTISSFYISLHLLFSLIYIDYSLSPIHHRLYRHTSLSFLRLVLQPLPFIVYPCSPLFPSRSQ